jgi:Ni/Fe-hydrogenase b-type cytochrome subunit
MTPKAMPAYIGHNPMAQLSYTMLYLMALTMALTGLALYTTAAPNGLMYSLFYPVTTILGGLQHVRLLHHVLSWFFLIFAPVHIYLAMRSDVIDRGGGVSQMINGGKFVPIDEDFEDAEG